MAELRHLQQRLFARIAWPIGTQPSLEAWVNGDARASAEERLDVYAGMYEARLVDTLRETHPAVAAVLADQFAEAARGYFALHPSGNPSLRFAGARFSSYLEGPLYGGSLEQPWLGELARLEWARLDVFDAEDAPVLDLTRLRAMSAADFASLEVRLVPAHSRIGCTFAVDETWRAAEAHAAIEAPGPEPLVLLVWRQGVDVYHRRVDALEAELLSLAEEGSPFAAICERIAERVPADRAASTAFQYLGRWAVDGLLRATDPR